MTPPAVPTPLTDSWLTTRATKQVVTTWSDVIALAGHSRRLETCLRQAIEALALADELCTAIEAAEQDIGGSRPTAEIIADLGPATDAALAAFRQLEKDAT